LKYISVFADLVLFTVLMSGNWLGSLIHGSCGQYC